MRGFFQGRLVKKCTNLITLFILWVLGAKIIIRQNDPELEAIHWAGGRSVARGSVFDPLEFSTI